MSASVASVGILLLAAGGSRRLGQPKQLLPWKGESLLRKAARAAVAAGLGPVVVVLGAEAARCRKEVSDLAVAVVENGEWESGMASSVRVGLGALREASPGMAGAIVSLCDQPLVTADVFDALCGMHRASCRSIVASQYGDALGAPAFFAACHFAALEALTGDAGARALFARHPGEVAALPCPAGAVDVDTPEDWQRLQDRQTLSALPPDLLP